MVRIARSVSMPYARAWEVKMGRNTRREEISLND